ncbi:MAG TPA: hypothetical protein VFS43_47595 [Polyangiaceae bacterium]|nr:hypothetical protein [Polyangiaceae bacterium]
MGRSVSWTDAGRVGELLARVSPAKRARPAVAVRPMGAAAPAAPAGPAAPAAAAPARPARRADEAARAPAPKLEHTSDGPVERLDALLAWALDHFPCAGAFVADDNGLTLAAHGIPEAHVAIVGPLLSALAAARTIPGIDATAGALWLGANMMSWVEVSTERGGFCLGVIGDAALSPAALAELKDALSTTVRPL